MAADVKIILTGLLPQSLNKSKRRDKILKVNNFINKSCKGETNIYYLEQDRNWVHKNQTLNTSLYFKDYLHIIEPEIDKFASKIVEMLSKSD